jgi:hypothetical protein
MVWHSMISNLYTWGVLATTALGASVNGPKA